MSASIRAEVEDFAERITKLGFAVYLAKSRTYGFITDESASRVLSFEFTGFSGALSGNYGPPSVESGTGWRMDITADHLTTPERVKDALYADPPSWCGSRKGKGWRYVSTVAQYLAQYDSSSHFTRYAIDR